VKAAPLSPAGRFFLIWCGERFSREPANGLTQIEPCPCRKFYEREEQWHSGMDRNSVAIPLWTSAPVLSFAPNRPLAPMSCQMCEADRLCGAGESGFRGPEEFKELHGQEQREQRPTYPKHAPRDCKNSSDTFQCFLAVRQHRNRRHRRTRPKHAAATATPPAMSIA
jgi:hypothetical protein